MKVTCSIDFLPDVLRAHAVGSSPWVSWLRLLYRCPVTAQRYVCSAPWLRPCLSCLPSRLPTDRLDDTDVGTPSPHNSFVAGFQFATESCIYLCCLQLAALYRTGWQCCIIRGGMASMGSMLDSHSIVAKHKLENDCPNSLLEFVYFPC